MSDKEILCKIYTELTQLNSQKKSIKNQQKI